jgi:peptide/nickel transport system substrate-binding protein
MAAKAETRPHYGGVLRIETQGAITALPRSDQAGFLLPTLGREIQDLLYLTPDCLGRCPRVPGPFRVVEFLPGKKLTLAVNDGYEEGRPFLDGIEITMSRAPREQILDLQLGRADVIDVPAENIRRASQEGVRLVASSPLELVAIVCSPRVDARVREAVSLSVDRSAIFNVLLGRQGAPTAALLPEWMTGYEFLFDASQNVTRARQLAVEAGRAKPITLAYDPQDSLARAIAERVALDARAAGLNIVPGTSANADAKLVRILLPAGDPDAAMNAIAYAVGDKGVGRTSMPGPEQYYEAEKEVRDRAHIIPLLHLPIAYGLSPRVQGWPVLNWGEWALDQVWLEQKP